MAKKSATKDDLVQNNGSLAVKVPATIRSRETLVQLIKRELRFPSNYKTNWDAFDEAITDLSWLNEKTVLLIHEGFPSLPDKDFRIYIDVLRYAIEDWKADGSKKLIVTFG